MLKIEKNEQGDVIITGDEADLKQLRYQIDETLEHKTFQTKTYRDVPWDAWQKAGPAVQVITKLT